MGWLVPGLYIDAIYILELGLTVISITIVSRMRSMKTEYSGSTVNENLDLT